MYAPNRAVPSSTSPMPASARPEPPDRTPGPARTATPATATPAPPHDQHGTRSARKTRLSSRIQTGSVASSRTAVEAGTQASPMVTGRL